MTALIATVQRKGGWSGSDQRAGTGIAPGEPQTGWNVEEHAVGTIRRIPLDGLTVGLQDNRAESAGARKLTDEGVAGPVTGPARSDPGEQKGRGRAIALVPSGIDVTKAVDVLFHLHGNTEREDRGFAGWRQHEKTGEVRDVARDRIAQQIEAAKSAQIVGVLPMGVNQSYFGQISPDSFIRDAFDRLVEVGAWAKPPPSFRVVLSAHSGGGFTVGRMIKGQRGYRLPANLKTLVLFEALHARPNDPDPKRRFDQVEDFATWIEGMLADHLAYLNDPAVATDAKQARLDGATQVRLYWDPRRGYNAIYRRLAERIDRWFAHNTARLGANHQALRNLVVLAPKAGATHEGIVRAGITESLTASTGGGSPPAPTGAGPPPVPAGSAPTGSPAQVPPAAAPGPSTTPAASFASREAAITGTMVAAQAGGNPAAAAIFSLARGVGVAPLPAAAMVLATMRSLDEVDLTDALFALVHPELHGGRIRPDQDDLKRDWMRIRGQYARPARPAPVAPAGRTTSAATGAAPTGPTPAVPTPAVPAAAAPTVLDPTTVKPAKAATGVEPLSDEARRKALENAVEQATTRGRKVDRDAVSRTLLYNDTDDETWWGRMVFDASFLDVPIRPSGGSVPGVHASLHARLLVAEKKLMSLFPGLSKAQIAGKMGLYQISGVRPPKRATGGTLPSYHCFGLAIDINHPTNPFVGNQKPTLDANADDRVTAEERARYDEYLQNRSPRIIERAMLLLRGEEFDIEGRIAVGKGPGSVTARLWEIHHRTSETLAEYLRLADDLDGARLEALVAARRAAGDTRDLRFWRQRIAEDRTLIKPWDFMHHKAPEKTGYMDMGKELVEALAEDGKLLWGGSYGGAKDMMHFDWRGELKRPPKGWKPAAS